MMTNATQRWTAGAVAGASHVARARSWAMLLVMLGLLGGLSQPTAEAAATKEQLTEFHALVIERNRLQEQKNQAVKEAAALVA